MRYYIKWEGYSKEANTWEPLVNLQNCIEMVQDFERNWSNNQFNAKNSYNYSYDKFELNQKMIE